MPRQSPPQSQGPQLIAEDLPPATSLLLSKSDCTSSEQVPHNRRSNRCKKTPCRHFLRTGGWCPAAEQCKFYHDVAALPSADVRKTEYVPPSTADARGGGRAISGGVLMGIQSPIPPMVNQAGLRYTEPGLAQPSWSSHYPHLSGSVPNDPVDQPMYWPNCTWQPYRPYYATVPSTAAVPIPSSVVQHCVCPPQPQAQTVPPSETRTDLPLGSYEVNGTTYFLASVPSVPAPHPVPRSLPFRPLPFNHAMAPAYPYHTRVPPTLSAGYCDVLNQTIDPGPQSSFDPFASDKMMPSELPVVPRLEDYQISPIQQDVLGLPLSGPSPLVANGDLGSPTMPTRPTGTQEHEFPYRPPREQCIGHARRISVNIKRHGRIHSG